MEVRSNQHYTKYPAQRKYLKKLNLNEIYIPYKVDTGNEVSLIMRNFLHRNAQLAYNNYMTPYSNGRQANGRELIEEEGGIYQVKHITCKKRSEILYEAITR